MTEDTNIKEQLAGLQRDLGRIEGKLDSVTMTLSQQDHDAVDLEQRVRSVEQKQYWVSGASAIIGMVAGLISNKLHF